MPYYGLRVVCVPCLIHPFNKSSSNASKSGAYHAWCRSPCRGVLRKNAAVQNGEAYVTVDGLPRDIMLRGAGSMNRALEGDVVAVCALPCCQGDPLLAAALVFTSFPHLSSRDLHTCLHMLFTLVFTCIHTCLRMPERYYACSCPHWCVPSGCLTVPPGMARWITSKHEASVATLPCRCASTP